MPVLKPDDHVTLYKRQGCTVCARVERFLDDHDIDHDIRDVDADPLTPVELWDLFNRKADRLRVPFTALNDGEDVVLGHDRDRLESVFLHGHLGGTAEGTGIAEPTVYDDFTSPDLDSQRWQTARVSHDGTDHVYEDPNAEVTTGDGELEVSILPFSAFHDQVQVLNNPKQLYTSTERITTPPGSVTTFTTSMAIETQEQIPWNLRDAFGTVNLLDFTTGMVLDFAATNDTVYVVYERLLLPGVTTPEEYFAHRVVVEVPTTPGQRHDLAICYDRDEARATWWADGELVYWAATPVPVEGFHLGMGLFSSLDIDEFTRQQREHGQGAVGRWGPWTVTPDRPQ